MLRTLFFRHFASTRIDKTESNSVYGLNFNTGFFLEEIPRLRSFEILEFGRLLEQLLFDLREFLAALLGLLDLLLEGQHLLLHGLGVFFALGDLFLEILAERFELGVVLEDVRHVDQADLMGGVGGGILRLSTLLAPCVLRQSENAGQ